MSEDYLTVTEAAEKLAVSSRTIQRYCKQGRLNYKWVIGKRHRELRIIPPIPVSELPGIKQKKSLDSFDFVSRNDFDTAINELKSLIASKDDLIEDLRKDIATMRSDGNGGDASIAGDATAHEILEKAESLLNDFRNVRPVEKKLILKVAKEVRDHAEFLVTLGMEQPDQDD